MGIVSLSAFLLVTTIFGWFFLRKVLKFSDILALLALAPLLGINIYIFLLNAVSYIIPVQISFYVVFILMFLSALFFLWYKPSLRSYKIDIGRKAFLYLILAVFVATIFFTLIFLANDPFDSYWHRPLIGTISEGNFPVKLHVNSELGSFYHYGFDLLVAALHHATGIQIYVLMDVIRILFLPITMLACFWLCNILFKSIRAAGLGTWFLFFGGSLTYFGVFLNLKHSIWIWDYIKRVTEKILSQEAFMGGYFHVGNTEIFGVLMHRPTTLFALPWFFWLVFVTRKFIKQPSLPNGLLFSISLGYFALLDETMFLMYGAALIVYSLWQFIKNIKKRENIKPFFGFVLVGILALLIAIFQGGTITDTLLAKISANSGMSEMGLTWRGGNWLLDKYDYYSTNPIICLIFLFSEWGINLVLLPFIIFYMIKKRFVMGGLLTVLIVIGICVPILFKFGVHDSDIVRFAAYANCVLAILVGYFLSVILGWKMPVVNKLKNYFIYLIIILVGFAPIMFNLRVMPMGLRYKEAGYSSNDIRIASRAKELLPDKSNVFTTQPLLVNELWGQYAFYGVDDYLFYKDPAKDYVELIDDFNVEGLKGLKYDYVYLSGDMSDDLKLKINNLQEEGGLELVVEQDLSKILKIK